MAIQSTRLSQIALGTIALKCGRTPLHRNLAFVGALAVFGYVAAVAASKRALPLLPLQGRHGRHTPGVRPGR